MDQDLWEKIKEIFERAIELPPDERGAFLDVACAGVDDLRRQIEALLADHEAAVGFIEATALEDFADALSEFRLSLAGETLSHYRMEDELGEGGMSEVYRAVDVTLGRNVAIKILPVEFTVDADLLRRFEQEARAVSSLNHPNIITVYEIGRHEEIQYIAYELVEGQTLRQRIRQSETNDSKLDWREALSIGAQIATALKAAHSAGIIHRDIKPENVMLRADGLVKVLDFGIAKRFDLPTVEEKAGPAPIGADATQVGHIWGTPGYLSPEQARGDEIDSRTDIFSLGIVLYEMLAGHPFAGKTLEEKLKEVANDKEPPPIDACRKDIPSALSAIVTKAIAKSRDNRYSSAGEMLGALDELRPPIEARAAEKERKLLARESANRLLNQFVALFASDKTTRLSPAAMWTIWRYSDIKRGELESSLLRRSLASAFWKTLRLALPVGLSTLAFAAYFSVDENWEQRVLNDGHTAAVRRAAFSPDGKLLVSVGEDNKVIVWDFARREMLKKFDDHTDWIISVAFSPDGKWFATASYDRTVIVWDAARLEKAATLRGHREGVCAVAFSPDGRSLVSAAKRADPLGDDTILWRVGSWEKVGGIPCHAGEPMNLLFSQDGQRLIFHHGCGDPLGHDPRDTWDLRTGQWLPNEFDPTWYGSNAVFSPDGKRLVSVDGEGEVIFVDRPRRLMLKLYRAHQDNGRATAWSPDGRLVATGAENVILWDAATMQKIATLEHSSVVWGLAFSPDSHWLVSTHGDGAVLVWDMVERRLAANFNEHSGQVSAVAFAPDGKRVASASEDRTVIVWDAATGRKEMTLAEHNTRVTGVAFAPGGDWLASVDRDGNGVIWDLAQRRPRLGLDPALGGRSETHCLAVSPDGRWVALARGVYESATGRQVVGFGDVRQINSPNTYGLTFSVDGRWLALADWRGNLLLWDTGTWQVADQANIAPAQLISVSFSPDGEWLVTGEDQGTVRLWSARPLRQVAELGRHKARVKSVAFSPDGKEVVSAGDDKTICLWSTDRRKLITRIGTHTSPVLSVAFSPDGKQIVSGERDHSVRLYARRRALWGWRFTE